MIENIAYTESRQLVGKIYKHYKGHIVEILAVSIFEGEPTTSCLITYRHIADGVVWTRTVSNFFERVTLPSGESIPRFAPLEKGLKSDLSLVPTNELLKEAYSRSDFPNKVRFNNREVISKEIMVGYTVDRTGYEKTEAGRNVPFVYTDVVATAFVDSLKSARENIMGKNDKIKVYERYIVEVPFDEVEEAGENE